MTVKKPAPNESLKAFSPELSAQWHPFKNTPLTPDSIPYRTNRKVWWQCTHGHEWQDMISRRIQRKTKCPYCIGRYAIPGKTDLATVNPALAAQWHPTKNGDLTPSMIKPGSAVRAWWLGTCGHEWQSSVDIRNHGANCPFCSNHSLLKGFNDLQTVAPALAQQWHPTKNGTLTPDSVMAYTTKPAFWRCASGHEWEMPIRNRVEGVGCPYCNNKKVLIGYNDLSTTHPDIAAEWHPTKNAFGPDSVTGGSQKKVVWLGKCGHEWITTVGSRTNGRHGCPYCTGKKLLKGFNDLATRFPEVAKEWHPTKNQPLTPSDIMVGLDTIWWKCKDCGHEWTAIPKNRVKGHGCPACANRRKGRHLRK